MPAESEGPAELTPAELARIRALIEADDRAKWAAAWVRTTLQYIAAIIIAGGVIWTAARDFVRGAAH